MTTQYPPHHVRGGTQLFKNQTTCSGAEKFFRSNCSGKSGGSAVRDGVGKEVGRSAVCVKGE